MKIYYVNNADKENKQIEQIIQLMLDKKRMRAYVVVIDNTTEQKDINDHIKTFLTYQFYNFDPTSPCVKIFIFQFQFDIPYLPSYSSVQSINIL